MRARRDHSQEKASVVLWCLLPPFPAGGAGGGGSRTEDENCYYRPPAAAAAAAAAASMSAVMWGRGAGEGIGLSGHKNEYKKGVRIGNWVEEQFGREAEGCGDRMKEFTKRQEAAQVAAAKTAAPEPSRRIEPSMGVPGPMLFSHGREFNENYQASMTALHFTDPSARAYGAQSNDRVHKSFFYGSKHIDQYVPKTNPNPRMALQTSKQADWAVEVAQARPAAQASDMYQTTSKIDYAR
jgi:hypothetical protein